MHPEVISAFQRLGPALLEGIGATALGFFGAELFFAAEVAALSPAMTLMSAVTAGVLVAALRIGSPPPPEPSRAR